MSVNDGTFRGGFFVEAVKGKPAPAGRSGLNVLDAYGLILGGVLGYLVMEDMDGDHGVLAGVFHEL